MQQLCWLAKEGWGLALVCFSTLLIPYGGWMRDPNMRSVRECTAALVRSIQAAHTIYNTPGPAALTEKPYTADSKALARRPTAVRHSAETVKCHSDNSE